MKENSLNSDSTDYLNQLVERIIVLHADLVDNQGNEAGDVVLDM